MLKYSRLHEWCENNGYTDAEYVAEVGWYAFTKEGVMKVPIQPPGYLLHAAISSANIDTRSPYGTLHQAGSTFDTTTISDLPNNNPAKIPTKR